MYEKSSVTASATCGMVLPTNVFKDLYEPYFLLVAIFLNDYSAMILLLYYVLNAVFSLRVNLVGVPRLGFIH